MSDQKAMVVRWFEEVWNKGRREVIDEMFPPEFVLHDGGTVSKGPDAFKPFYDRMRMSFSDIKVTPDEAVSEGDLVCLRWSVTMRHTGDGLGMPATGKQLHTTGMTMVRFANGRFSEAWQNWDMMRLMEQIHDAPQAKTYIAAR
jgi:steroid delta-isomerase-like uncharacterized protein